MIPTNKRHGFLFVKSSHLELSIFDIRGRLVRVLLSDYEANGMQKIIWDGTDRSGISVPSGLYICRLSTSEYSLMKKLILQK